MEFKRKIKLGLDIHGMIDSDPKFFAELSRVLVEAGHEVHITTGSFITPEIVSELKNYGMEWTHLWSISDYYKSKPEVEMWYDEKGRPWVSDELWNKAKAEYAKEQELDLLLDDTEVYGKYFTTSFGFCKVLNKSGKIKEVKATMPDKPKT